MSCNSCLWITDCNSRFLGSPPCSQAMSDLFKQEASVSAFLLSAAGGRQGAIETDQQIHTVLLPYPYKALKRPFPHLRRRNSWRAREKPIFFSVWGTAPASRRGGGGNSSWCQDNRSALSQNEGKQVVGRRRQAPLRTDKSCKAKEKNKTKQRTRGHSRTKNNNNKKRDTNESFKLLRSRTGMVCSPSGWVHIQKHKRCWKFFWKEWNSICRTRAACSITFPCKR